MPSEEAGGQAEEGWTPEQKGKGSAGGAGGGGDPGEAGDAEPKGRPSDDRAETEAAAMKIEKEKSEGQPS
jgi:hypothetical protein